MSALQASRRGFISSLAILTAGVALGSNVSGIISDGNLSPNLEVLWKNFCLQQLTTTYAGVLEAKKEIVACKGHKHCEGQLVYFPGDNIVAQPIWIYWAAHKNKPSDVIINFYKNGVAIGTLNQFEVKALCETKGEANPLTAFFKINDDGTRLYTAQTTVGASNQITTQFTVLKPAGAFV